MATSVLASNGLTSCSPQVSWQMICGNNYTSPSGTIVSPNYPNRYPNGASCAYRILAPPQHYVQIYFKEFELEGNKKDIPWYS